MALNIIYTLLKSDLLTSLMLVKSKFVGLDLSFTTSGGNLLTHDTTTPLFLNVAMASKDLYAILLFSLSIIVFVTSIFILKKANLKSKGDSGKVQNNSAFKEDISLNELLKEKEVEVMKIREYYENITEMLAHDLKNPLNIILHQLDHLDNNGTKQTIENAGNLMMNMLQNVLDVQKYTSSQIPLNKEKTNFAHLLSTILKDTDILIKKKNVRIHYHSEFTYWVMCDADIINRVLTNLLINFIKYANHNETINIRSIVQNNSVRISVSANIDTESVNSIHSYLTKQDFEITESKSSSFLRILFFKLAIASHGENLGIEKNHENEAELWFTLPLVKKEHEPVQNQVQNGVKAMKFKKENIEKLEEYIERIRQYSIYELSKIKAVINEIPDLEDSVVEWKNELLQSLTSMNEQRFIHLLDNATKSTEQHEK